MKGLTWWGCGVADEQNELAGQVAEVRRIAEVGFTDVAGKLALIRQGQGQGERHAELASTVAENYRAVSKRLDEHAKAIQAAAEERSGEQTMADSAPLLAGQSDVILSGT